ncbi:hypothetical protein ACQV2C_03925 [Pantoea allii]|uniref:hypothetical protein n=1 Tax=Pantoea allii TaxID=574096 RepID=UPI003D312B78
MQNHDYEGVRGITPEYLVNDLSANEAGYVLEITTDGYGDNVLVEGGMFGNEILYAEIDFGDTNNLNSDLGKNFSNENCMRLTGGSGTELTLIADGRNFIAYDEREQEAELCNNSKELADFVDNWIKAYGKVDNT